MRVESIAAYADWGDHLKAQGWTGYLVTIMFQQLSGSPQAIIGQMRRIIETQLYRALCMQSERHPGRPGRFQWLPRAWLWFDLPVAKDEKQRLVDVTRNGGLHVHGLIFMAP